MGQLKMGQLMDIKNGQFPHFITQETKTSRGTTQRDP